MHATRSPLPPDRRNQGSDPAARGRGIERVALVAMLSNLALTVGQIAIGLFAGAFSLVADAAHTLSDLIADLLVLMAGRRSAAPADPDHPYGYGRIETVTSLALGLALVVVGLGFLWSSGMRLQQMSALTELHPVALGMALVTLAAKEGLFHYMLRAARRLQAPLLETNAWHARSDAASSLVVAAGIGGSLAGYPVLEPMAAAVVGFLILRMGFGFAAKAVRELIDTGLPEEELARLRQTILDTPGVISLHEMRTRRAANHVLCDAHVQVDPRLTVSEGHRISDTVHARVRAAHPEVRNVLVHVDPEDDTLEQTRAPEPLPDRDEIERAVCELLQQVSLAPAQVRIHYLSHQVDVEVVLETPPSADTAKALDRHGAAWLAARPCYRSLSFFTPMHH